jgi:hypothetical protein
MAFVDLVVELATIRQFLIALKLPVNFLPLYQLFLLDSLLLLQL